MLLQGREELNALVTRVTESALNAQGQVSHFHDADVHELVCSQVLAYVGTTLVKVSRQHNDRHAFERNVPDEIWCMIWALLPIADLIIAARVCHSWRVLALATPQLWCELDFGCYGADESTGDGHDNLAQVLLCLSHTGTQPLKLRVDIGYHGSERKAAIAALRDALSPHVARLVSVRFSACELEARLIFFSEGLARLPAVRVLSMNAGILMSWAKYHCQLVNGPCGLIALQELDMHGSGEILQQPLPALVSLSCQYGCAATLADYLSNAPGLRNLRLRACNYPIDARMSVWESDQGPRVRAHAPPCVRVQVDDLELQGEAAMLTMFGAAERTELRLNYATLRRTAGGTSGALSGLRILRHITKLYDVSGIVERNDPRTGWPVLSLYVTGDGDKKRALGVPWDPVLDQRLQEVRFFDLCDYLESPPRSMTLEARLWTLLKLNSGVTSFLQRLTLHLSPATDNLTPSVPPGTDFASLEEIRLEVQGQNAAAAVEIQVSIVTTFLRSLRPHGRVPRLVLSRVVLLGDVEELRDFCVHVG